MYGNPWASGSLRATGSSGLQPESKEAGDVTPKMFIQSQADKMSSTNWPLYIFLNRGPQKNLETDACCQWPKNYGVDSKYSSWFPVAWLQNPLFRYFSIHQMSIFITWTRVEMWKLLAIKTAAADSVWLHFIVPPAGRQVNKVQRKNKLKVRRMNQSDWHQQEKFLWKHYKIQ